MLIHWVNHRAIARPGPALAAGVALVAILAFGSAPAGATTTTTATTTVPGGTSTGRIAIAKGAGVTVSWLPTTQPVEVVPGKTTTGTFWVTNETQVANPVTILPARAIPGNDGNLSVTRGKDPRFSKIVYSPEHFVAEPATTTPVTITVTTPPSLDPGVYLVPAVVKPTPEPGKGNIKIEQEVDALVTFQVPGTTKARVRPYFVTSSTFSVPGLPAVQLGTSGSVTLRVVDDSPSSFYAYNQVTATQTPLGSVVLTGHTPDEPSQLRTTGDLYFPGRHRDFPVTWHPSPVGFGVAHLQAVVTYHPKPTLNISKVATVQIMVVSPFWILVFAVYLLLLLAGARRRGRRQVTAAVAAPRKRSAVGRIGQVVGSVVMILIVVEAAFLSSPLVLAVVGVVGALGAVAGIATARRCDRAKTAQGILRYELVAGLLVVVGVVLTVLAGLSDVSADLAVGFLAGAGIWSVLSWWMLWWNEERKEPVAPPPASEPPAEEPVPVLS